MAWLVLQVCSVGICSMFNCPFVQFLQVQLSHVSVCSSSIDLVFNLFRFNLYQCSNDFVRLTCYPIEDRTCTRGCAAGSLFIYGVHKTAAFPPLSPSKRARQCAAREEVVLIIQQTWSECWNLLEQDAYRLPPGRPAATLEVPLLLMNI